MWFPRGGAALALPLVVAAALGGCLAAPPPPAAEQGDAAAVDESADAAFADAPVADQLLDNENFERGSDGWAIDGNAMIGDGDTLGVSFTAASGEVFAQVGRRNWTSNGIAQLVTVPAWAASLRLTGQHCFDSEDDDPSPDDILNVLLLDAEGSELEVLLTVSNADVGTVCDWTEFALDAAASHAGDQIQIALVASADGNGLTAFWFDDLRLVASPD